MTMKCMRCLENQVLPGGRFERDGLCEPCGYKQLHEEQEILKNARFKTFDVWDSKLNVELARIEPEWKVHSITLAEPPYPKTGHSARWLVVLEKI